ncbi:unnamed protein product [Amoebophrya sp. A120]|nr:unnamed protein product [Amoebophrya sp. A120]|eukprot:GSA120T00017982001.1
MIHKRSGGLGWGTGSVAEQPRPAHFFRRKYSKDVTCSPSPVPGGNIPPGGSWRQHERTNFNIYNFGRRELLLQRVVHARRLKRMRTQSAGVLLWTARLFLLLVFSFFYVFFGHVGEQVGWLLLRLMIGYQDGAPGCGNRSSPVLVNALENPTCGGLPDWMRLQKRLLSAMSGQSSMQDVVQDFAHLLDNTTGVELYLRGEGGSSDFIDGKTSSGDDISAHSFAGEEDQPQAQEEMNDYSRRGGMNALGLLVQQSKSSSPPTCVLGYLALRLLLQLGREDGFALETLLLRRVGWDRIARSGWPIFRLLRYLESSDSTTGKVGGEQDASWTRSSEERITCGIPESDPSGAYYRSFLFEYVVKHRQRFGDGLVPETAAYLAQPEKQNPCTLAAAFVALAWSRIPIYNSDTDGLLRRAQQIVEELSVADLLQDKQHPLLALLDETASAFEAFLIDGGYFYYDEDEHEQTVDESPRSSSVIPAADTTSGASRQPTTEAAPSSTSVDYTRHMMPPGAATRQESDPRACVVGFATRKKAKGNTSEPLCDPYAAIAPDLARWRAFGVTQKKVHAALNQITDAKNLLFRYIREDSKLLQILPDFSHLNQTAPKPAFEKVGKGEQPVPQGEEPPDAIEPSCLADFLVEILQQSPSISSFDLVLNHGDMPILRKNEGTPPFYNLLDQEARAPLPLFSIASNQEFFDILFPNVCRPQLVNLTEVVLLKKRERQMEAVEAAPTTTALLRVGEEEVPSSKIKKAFWRGTDRGAVNWSHDYREMLQRGSPRREFLRQAEKRPDLFDVAFLEDDLSNVTVVNSDPNFVPLDEQQDRWAYALDLPGNGYSGGLKQKLTGKSLVLLATEIGNRGRPVYEHYHLGLTYYEHLLPITLEAMSDQVEFARELDAEAISQLISNANRYMERYALFSRCYVWLLLKKYSSYLTYAPSGEGLSVEFPGTHHREHVLRRAADPTTVTETGETTAFEEMCRADIERYT